MQKLASKPCLYEVVSFTTPEGVVKGKVIELWEDQNIVVVEVEDDLFMANYFVPYGTE